MENPSKSPTLVELAERILKDAKIIEGAVGKSPTFQEDTLKDLPQEFESTRKALVDSIETIGALVQGSDGLTGRIYGPLYKGSDLTVLEVLYHFRIPQAVPLEGSISYGELAEKCNADAVQLMRVLHLAMTNHLFWEPKKGFIAHTADSRLLATDEAAFNSVGMSISENQPALHSLAKAMKRWPGSQEPNQTAHALANETELPFYKFLQSHPERLKLFNARMKTLAKGSGSENIRNIVQGYPWQLIEKGTVVDVGGAGGHLSIALAKKYPEMKFIVEDLAIDKSQLTSDLEDRVSFIQHDFFKPQPVKDADVYLLSLILHNWPDKYSVEILRALVPALKPGARVLVSERLIPEPGEVPNSEMKEFYTSDIVMMTLMNAKSHTIEDMKELFGRADGRLKFTKAYGVEGSWRKICEAVWTP
ncbi:S-adenosyl-L-methionine-dependent methyltransferase [Aulographum hederae CBS 113979]|uniref:S-adenosyl-L-methionine-dependent methyltransferase n=1 Tax=Aulographum hederae CBS 113979 TaxID=1176131 RepID=A0A6G1GWU9_9PEZI|nr:S-adenosyl-L-methionine-dependent methyltransferase [Aulographum hederae CBS 113979]